MSKNKRTRLITLGVGIVVGAVGGWLYWRFIGCLGGSCPIWSNPWISTGYGGLLGYLLAGLLPFGTPKFASETESTDPDSGTRPTEG